jgi:hypothetical protein
LCEFWRDSHHFLAVSKVQRSVLFKYYATIMVELWLPKVEMIKAETKFSSAKVAERTFVGNR